MKRAECWRSPIFGEALEFAVARWRETGLSNRKKDCDSSCLVSVVGEAPECGMRRLPRCQEDNKNVRMAMRRVRK